MTKINDRFLAYLQSEFNLFDLFRHLFVSKEDIKEFDNPEEEAEDKFERYIKHMIKMNKERLNEISDIGMAHESSILFLRQFSDKDLEELIRSNKDNIQNKEIEKLYTSDDILKYKLPSKEEILIELSEPVYVDDPNNLSVAGRYILLNNQKPVYRYHRFKFRKDQAEEASEKEKKYFNLAYKFFREERAYGEFKNGDLFYIESSKKFFVFDDQIVKELIEDIINEDVIFVTTRESLEYMMCEEW